ncbi:MAG: hypothetical protein J6Y02_20795 [Pseudobutyrivibrio sp.]|nr:hypothetical protein [Pseudobutyrivibrio sp.]
MPHSQVDEQVVKMSFDNSNFDGNINDSIKALNSLDNKLGVLNKHNFGSLTNNVDNLAKTFSVKGQIMLGVLTSLGNKIYELGNRAFRKLTQGIRDGVGEYNTIIESTEAIYQNVKQNGNSLQDVNNALDELNDYSDKTIYNFGQMTRMIGMFASAGVGLKSSVSTIKGLANSAALVGANMQKAQIAWNAVSRAMSSGRFTNMTWRSLELSGIAGKQFNKVITEVARTMKVKGKQTGKDIDGMIKKWGSLRESLREGWLTKDVFTEAMDIMSGAMDKAQLKKKGYTDKQIQELTDIANAAEEAATRVKTFKQLMDTIGEAIGSGWAQSFRILIGDLEEAKKLYTRISNVISDFIDNNSNIRNELFKQIVNGKDKSVDGKWKSGRDNFRQIIENMLAIVKTFLKSVKTGFLNIFPIDRISAAARKVLGVIEKFTRAFVLNTGKIQKDGQELWNTSDIEAITKAVENLIKFFRGLASAVDIAWMAISQPIKSVIKHIPFFDNFYENTNTGLLGIIKKLGMFGDKITAFRDAVKDWEIFGYLTDYFLDNIEELGKKYPVLGAILWVFNGLKKAITNAKDAFNSLNIKPLSAAFGLFKMVATSLWNILNGIFEALRSAKNSVDWSWLEGPKQAVINALKTLSDYGKGLLSFEQVTEKIGGIFARISTFFNNLFTKNNTSDKIATVTTQVEKRYANLSVTVGKTEKKVESLWDKIKGFFSPIADFFKNLTKGSNLTFDNLAKKIGLIGGGLGIATLGMSHFIKTFQKIKILDNLNDLLVAGIDVLKAYQRQAQAKTILIIAAAIGILAASMAALAFIPYDKLENGLAIFTAFMAVLMMTLPPIITAMAKFNESLGKTKAQLDKFDVMNNLVDQVGKFGKKIAKGINAKLIGQAFKDIAIGIFILVGAIAALVLLFKLDSATTIKAMASVAGLIIILTAAVGGLVVLIERFTKATAKTKASIGTFSTFFKLAGVATVILSISAAILVLVGALAIMTKLDSDKLHESWIILLSIMGMLGLIAMYIATVTSRSKDFGKLKKVTVSMSGAFIGIAAVILAMRPLIEAIKKDNSNAWLKAIGIFTLIIAQFTLMVTTLLFVAKKIGGSTTVWEKLNKTMVIMTASLVAIAGVLYVIGKMGSIKTSVVVTIGIMTAAVLGIISLLALLAIVISNSKSTFTGNFVKVIEAIALSISALIASIGVMAAGIGVLIYSIASIDIPTSDANKASTNVVNKLAYIANVISKALPELRKLFYSIGSSAGTIFVSFTTGFLDRIIEVGDAYNGVAEKIVNLIIDLLGKIVNTLHERKDDVAKIIAQVVDFIGAEFTAALNAFFKKDGEGAFKQEDVTRWLGITVIGAAIIKALGGIIKVFDTVKDIFGKIKLENILTKFEALKSGFADFGKWVARVAGKIAKAFSTLGTKIGAAFSKFGSAIGSGASSVASLAVAILGIIASITAVIGAFKRWTGEVKNVYDKNASFGQKAVQVLVDGFAFVGRIIIQIFMTVVRVIAGIVSGIVTLVANAVNFVVDLFGNIIGFFNKDAGKAIEDWREKYIGTFTKNMNETTGDLFKGIIDGWKNVGNFAVDETNWNGAFAKTSYDAGKEVSENYKQGSIDGLDGMSDEMKKKIIDAGNEVINANKEVLDEHSPSKVAYGIYWNYILGAKNALSDGGKELIKVMESNNKKLIKSTITGSKNIQEAYSKVGANLGNRAGLNQYKVSYNSYDSNGNVEYKTVELNKELTEQILAQQEALRGKNKEEIKAYVNQQAIIMGLENATEESGKLLDYLFKQQKDQTVLIWDSVETLEKATQMSWGVVLTAEEEASMEALNKQIETNRQLIDIAEDKKKQLVGKSKEQAQQILKDELVARGMSEEQAEEEAHKMVALMISKQKQKKTIEAKGLNNAVALMQAETDAYEASLKEQTELLEKEIEKRGKLQENASDWQKKADSGKIKTSEDYKAYVEAQRQYIQQKDKVNGLKNQLNKIVEETAKKMAKDGTLNAGQFEKDYADAYKKINSNNKKSGKSIKETLANWWKDATGKIPKAIDPSTWNLNTGGNNNNLKDDKTKAIDASKDLKKNLEANRADLTPTFDLDKLASDANKANGIVMSSLTAAQNAAIGDYINTNSELNPFMKDRWQNVYNFTQNNYSPKALSRIDIYRQTQRQLSMSRGF